LGYTHRFFNKDTSFFKSNGARIYIQPDSNV
jgi:hypothetical protein